jgi:hypothetical protein
MHYLMYLVILSVTLMSYLSVAIHVLPSPFKFVPDVLSVIVAVWVVAVGLRTHFRLIAAKYWLVFGALVVVIFCGVVANGDQPGPIVSGLRYYLRAVPFFFVPAVFNLEDWKIRRYMTLLLGLSLVQVPLAIYQRHVIFIHERYSGDDVYGTLMLSGILSMFLICVLCVLAGLMLRHRFGKIAFVVLMMVLVIPMSINETKVTVFLLPIALLATFFVGSPPEKRVKVTAVALLLIAGAGAIFVPLYDYYNTKNNPYPFTIEDFVSNKQSLQTYLDQGTDVGSRKEAGRIDALTTPLHALARDPIKLAFGLGVGNASHSSIGSQFMGAYQGVYGRYSLETSAAAFTLEMGLLGLALILLWHWHVWRDALAVAREDQGLIGAIAAGWVGASFVIVPGLFYINCHGYESLSYMFWFFSGIVASARVRLSLAKARERSVRSRPAAEGAVPRAQPGLSRRIGAAREPAS